MVDAGWVANQGRNLPYSYNINQGLPGAGPTAEILNLEYGRTASTTIRAYGVNSNYNSLQVNARKQWSKGFHVSFAYTFSKSLDETAEDGGFLNPYNFKQSYGPSSFDQTHMITINHVYELPFGKGQRLLNHRGNRRSYSRRLATERDFPVLLGNPLHVPPYARHQRQLRVMFRGSQIVGTAGLYPGLYGPGQLYLSPSAFALETVDTRGNSGRDNLRGPGMTVYDANVVRKFHIKERVTAEFGFEATNVTNHPHWGNPSATVNSATFGQITTASNPRQALVAMRG